MAIQNDFLPFAVESGANVLTQAAYEALSAVAQGYQSGTASSAACNKTWRQSSVIAAVIAEFIVAQTNQPAIDDGTTGSLLAGFTAAVGAASKNAVVLADTGAANAYTASNAVPMTALPTASGVLQTISVAHSNTGGSTYAPDGLPAEPIFGLGGLPLQGGEIVAKGIATFVSYVGPLLNGGGLCWVLVSCTGGVVQVATPPANDNSNSAAPTKWIWSNMQSLMQSAIAAVATAAGFEFLVAQNGYVRFPSWLGSLIIQWGLASSTSAAINNAVATLPISFQSAGLVALAVVTGNAEGDYTVQAENPPGLTTAAFTCQANGSYRSGIGIAYITLGF